MELLNFTYAESSVDKLVHALLEVYNYHGKAINFIQTAIELDVRSANEEGVLMRSETVGTRVLSLYMGRRRARVRTRAGGAVGLQDLGGGGDQGHGTAAQSSRRTSTPGSYWTSPKLPRGHLSLGRRLPSVRGQPLRIPHIPHIPPMIVSRCRQCALLPCRAIRRVLRMVGDEVGRRWPQMLQPGILNLLFLRFLTPAILASPASTPPPK